MKSGRIFNSSLFTFRAVKVAGKSRFAVTASKKIFKTAVERNRIRRRVYAQLEKVMPRVEKGFHGAFIVKSALNTASPSIIYSEIEGVFVKTGIMK
jgi:ribonuclease P protein component